MIALLVILALPCGDGFHLRYVATQAAIPPARFAAIARVESACNLSPRLRAHVCAAPHDCEVGRFQIRPSTARRRCPGMNVRSYRGNVDCAARILGENIDWFGLTDGTRKFNGSGPKTYEYLYHVLKAEEAR